jgi:hypothetical protein
MVGALWHRHAMTVRVRRSCVALVAMLVVVAQLAAFAHEAAVRHVRCAAHDELVEATDAGATSVFADGTAVHQAGGRRTDADHDHCAIATAIHAAVDATSHAAVVADVPPAAIPAIAGTDVAAHAVAAYRFAPKTSPPRTS